MAATCLKPHATAPGLVPEWAGGIRNPGIHPNRNPDRCASGVLRTRPSLGSRLVQPSPKGRVRHLSDPVQKVLGNNFR